MQILSFPARKWFSALHKQSFEGEICALLLAPAKNTSNHFRRIGTARIPVSGQVEDVQVSYPRRWISGVLRQISAPDLGSSAVWNTQTLTMV